jgi:preprotein translocase subunit YajC
MILLQAAAGGAGIANFIFPLAIVGVMYFMMIRPQMKRQKETVSFQQGLSKGMRVVSGGGIVGKIINIDERFVTLETGKSTIIVTRASILNSVSDELVAEA